MEVQCPSDPNHGLSQSLQLVHEGLNPWTSPVTRKFVSSLAEGWFSVVT